MKMKKALMILIAMSLILLSIGSIVSCAEPEPAPSPAPAPAPAPKPAPAPEPVVMKFASAAMGNYVDGEQAFVDAFNARCGPDYTIEYYGSESMLSFPELLDGVRTGAADMAAVTPNFNSFDEPKLGAVELPFLLNNLDAHRYAVPGLLPLYDEILEKQFNQKLLCLHNYTGMALIATKPVKVMEDWNGLLVQAISPVIAAIIESLGGAPVTGQPYTESYSLMEKGTVDGVITAPAAMRIFALPDVGKYMTSAYMVPAIHGFSINLDTWNKLPKNIQDILLEEAKKQSDVIDEWLVGEWVKDHEAIAAAGVEIYKVPQAEIDKWKAACQPYFDEQMAIYGDFGVAVKKIADEANAKFPN
jgi:TRAP-type C4-dicarboxylate transport system substrate-binding protein